MIWKFLEKTGMGEAICKRAKICISRFTEHARE